MKKKLWGICSEAAPVKGTAAHVPVCWVCSLSHALQHLVVGSGDDNVLYWPPALIVAGYYWFNIHMPVVVYWVSRGKKKKKTFGFEYILYAFTVVWLKKTKKKFFQIEFFIKKNQKKRKEKKPHRGVFTSAFLKIILQASPSCRPSAKHPVGLERSSPLPERSNFDR